MRPYFARMDDIGKPLRPAQRERMAENAVQAEAVMKKIDAEVAQAKYLAGELAYKCSQYAMRILGAYGYSTEYPVARYYRDAPTYAMVEGSANICKFIIAQDQLGIRKANR